MKPAALLITLALVFIAGMGTQAYIGANTPQNASGTNLGATTPAYASRYQAVDDMLTMQQRIDRLESELRETRGQIGAQIILRAGDIEAHKAARKQDQLRLSSLEISANDLYDICTERQADTKRGR
jgi:hypothetical protein